MLEYSTQENIFQTDMIKTVIKHYNELTTDELYRIIQLRINGFIVENKVCYQDLEAYYDKNSYWFMHYDVVLGVEPQLMVGTNSLCTTKILKGKNRFTKEGEIEYKYPCFRRQAWLDSYKGGCSTYDLETGKDFCIKTFGSPNMMLEITYKHGKQPFLDFGCEEVGYNIDGAGRENWVFVYEPTWLN